MSRTFALFAQTVVMKSATIGSGVQPEQFAGFNFFHFVSLSPDSVMKLLFVHERIGAFPAEENSGL
ncbi:MAG: hypothetical protein EXS35_11670 [Pedosphaera sp.]|nr:hypothetical protein [Pedosphaera sp.]